MMTMTDLEALKTLEEYATFQGDVRARMKGLYAEFGVKPFTPEAQSEWTTLDELDKELSARITEKQALRDRLGEIDSEPHREPAFKPAARSLQAIKARRVPEDIFALEQYRNLSNSEPELMRAYRDGAMFAVERATFSHPAAISHEGEARAHIQMLLDSKDTKTGEFARRVLATDSPTYKEAFTKLLINPSNPGLTREEAASMDSSSTGTTGGYAVPVFLDPTVVPIGVWTSINPFRAACRIEQIIGSDIWHGITATAVTATRGLQNAVATDSSPTFGQPSVEVFDVQSLITYSIGMGQDRPDIATQMAKLFSEAKDNEEEGSYATGDGTGANPLGMLAAYDKASFTLLTSATANTLAIADIDTTEAAVPLRHRVGAAWFMSRRTLRAIQGFETTATNGRLFGGQFYSSVGGLTPNTPTGNVGRRLLDYPIYEVPSAWSTDVTTSHKVVLAFGDPKQYLIVDRVGMNIEVIPHMFDGSTPSMPYGKRGLYAIWRNNATPFVLDGMRRLEIHVT